MSIEPFKIQAWKENGETKIFVPENEISQVGISLAFDAIEKEINEKLKSKKLLSKQEGTLSILAKFPDSEPWETTAQIICEGFSFEEICKIVRAIDDHYYKSFNPLS
jgi:hypothetical protein